jgi:magnesium chelatase family protein
MSLAIVYSRASCGIEAPQVTIEIHLSPGLPSLSIVGLPETAVKESKDRVRSALINSNFEFPYRRITINLAPADLPKKDGGRFDLPIALGILAASGQLPAHVLLNYEFAGELALCGKLRNFSGALPFALAMKNSKRSLIIPQNNADEAAMSKDVIVLPAQHLLEVYNHLTDRHPLTAHQAILTTPIACQLPDLIDIRGQEHAKRALTIAATGQHSMLMIGPPGTGKSMLANRILSILPLMSANEALEVAAINSVCGKKFNVNEFYIRPFRTPHHTASSVALVGGSSPPKPGEISLAHNGVLFLDELPEFNRNVLEALREPIESGFVTISRAAHQSVFPANFQLIAAMNPCPCGHYGNNKKNCHCTPDQIQRYKARISGPLLDRFDIQIEVPAIPQKILLSPSNPSAETSVVVREKVIAARAIQLTREKKLNATLTNYELDKYCKIDNESKLFLEATLEKLQLSARAYHKIVKLARTIADLDQRDNITIEHLAEAIGYRKIK